MPVHYNRRPYLEGTAVPPFVPNSKARMEEFTNRRCFFISCTKISVISQFVTVVATIVK